jgi:enamine deaminase RidA (YjgF/YER057c/UK114 family)
MLTATKINDVISYSAFTTPAGCDEFFMAIATRPDTTITGAIAELMEDYSRALERAGLSDDTVAFSRLFVKDIAHQKPFILQSPLFKRLAKGALSVIEQKPVNGGPISLLSYHLRRGKNGLLKKIQRHSPDGWQNSAIIKGKNYPLLFTANFTSDSEPDTYGQTMAIFESLHGVIAKNNMRLADDAIRTWVFVRDIDDHYGAMVHARKDYFASLGLTEKTRYLASTGIQGNGASPGQLVTVDSLSIGGLQPGQIIRMKAPDHLSPTIQYGVTFERGLRVRFGDRSHLYISGTASIDHKGEVLFIGDVRRQTRRTIENIRALLAAHGATFDDMAYIIAYIRDLDDRKAAGNVLVEEIGKGTPLIFAQASVCRPTWLVELEGTAIIHDKSEFSPFL